MFSHYLHRQKKKKNNPKLLDCHFVKTKVFFTIIIIIVIIIVVVFIIDPDNLIIYSVYMYVVIRYKLYSGTRFCDKDV